MNKRMENSKKGMVLWTGQDPSRGMEGDGAHVIRSNSGNKNRALAGRVDLGQAFLQNLSHRPLTPQRERAGELFLQAGRLVPQRLRSRGVWHRGFKTKLGVNWYGHLFAPIFFPLSPHPAPLSLGEGEGGGTGAGK